QAEDGIRDFHVTGVQTCALPIWGTVCPPGKPLDAWVAVICAATVWQVSGVVDDPVFRTVWRFEEPVVAGAESTVFGMHRKDRFAVFAPIFLFHRVAAFCQREQPQCVLV